VRRKGLWGSSGSAELAGDVGAAAVSVDDRCADLRIAHLSDHGLGLLVPKELARPVNRVAAARPVQVVQAGLAMHPRRLADLCLPDRGFVGRCPSF
jgi:hypothetical protein